MPEVAGESTEKALPDQRGDGSTQQKPSFSWKHLVANLGLVLGAVAVALVIGEAITRVLAPQQLILIEPGVWQPVDTIGYTFRAGLDRSLNTGERTVRLITDRDGFRVGSAGRVVADSAIMLMGDSFLGALQVEYEQSLPGIMQQELPGTLGFPVAIRNAAVPGWDPAQYFYRTRTLVGQDKYQLVVVGVYVGNDAVARPLRPVPPIKPIISRRFRWPRRVSWAELVDAWLRPFNDVMETHSHLFVLAKKQFQTVLMRVGLTPEYFPVEFRRSEASSPRWNNTADILKRLATAADPTPTLFVLIPTPFQVDSAVFTQYLAGFDIDPATVDLDQPSVLLGAALESRGLRVLDALPRFRELTAAGRSLYGQVDRHLTPAGHQALWELIRPTVYSLLGDPPPARRGPGL